ncbi:hypothetical protein [Micromonospora sp. NPDC005087]|uniref:hypothetical protein n=1 Tax=Micromonospora sp. NPDC005087 TaxID=3364225 RepID=UPI00369FBBF0
MSGDDWWEERETLREAGATARREADRKRDERFNKIWQRDHPRPGGTRASDIASGFKGSSGASVLREMVKKAQPDDFTRLEREVERGRPLSGLARRMYDEEKARREGGSDEG